MTWDDYFLSIADTVRWKSKDPSTKCGAVIVGPERQILSTGYNGFPFGVDETDPLRWERPTKYKYVEHAERNAIFLAARHGTVLRESTLYLIGMGPPTGPCGDCAKAIIQSGISKVIARPYKPLSGPMEDSIRFGIDLLNEAGVRFYELNATIRNST